jgi:hypothetical protein
MRKISLILLGIALVFSLTACGSKQTSVPNDFDRRIPDFGQPESDASLSGIVSEIIGNEVIVLKIERPDMSEEVDVVRRKSPDEEEKTTGIGMGMPPGMRGGSGRFNQASDDTSLAEMMKEMSSGEEKVIIPVGIQMLKKEETGERGMPNMIAATLEDVKTNSMLMIWLDESITDRNVAKFVVIN